MALLNIPDITNGTSADASDVNSIKAQIVKEFNGGIDSTNLADNAVTTAKIVDSSITSSKLAPTKTIDANGWTTYNYGTWKEYYKVFDWDLNNIDAGVNYGFVAVNNWPVGKTEVDLFTQRTVKMDGNAPFFNYGWENETLYVRNITGATMNPGPMHITVSARDK
jgi:hypothetical protein